MHSLLQKEISLLPEPYHKMVMETITKAIASLGASDIDEKLEVRLVDGVIFLPRADDRVSSHAFLDSAPSSMSVFASNLTSHI